MKASELVKILQTLISDHGDLTVEGYWDNNVWGIHAVEPSSHVDYSRWISSKELTILIDVES